MIGGLYRESGLADISRKVLGLALCGRRLAWVIYKSTWPSRKMLFTDEHMLSLRWAGSRSFFWVEV